MPSRFSYPDNRETLSAARARALESLLIEKGIITGGTVDKVLTFFETKMGPFNGAKLVARAWVDPAFKARLVADTPAAIADGPGAGYISSHTSTGTSAMRIRVSRLGAVSSMMRPGGPSCFLPCFLILPRRLDTTIQAFCHKDMAIHQGGQSSPV